MRINPKRRYFDLRNGWGVIAPIFGFSNFIMLAYMTLIKDAIPIWVFGILFAPIIIIILVIIGNVFRKKQMRTDLDVSYMEASESAKSLRILYDIILEPDNLEKRMDAIKRREFLKGIEDKLHKA